MIRDHTSEWFFGAVMDFVFNRSIERRYNSKMSTTDIRCEALGATFRKGQRNGNWRKLKFVDKALYRAAIAKHHSIANEKLVETSGAHVISSGWGRCG